MAENELASQQPSRPQPIGLGIPQGAGTAAKYELASQQASPQQPLGLGRAKAAAAAADDISRTASKSAAVSRC